MIAAGRAEPVRDDWKTIGSLYQGRLRGPAAQPPGEVVNRDFLPP